MRYTVLLLSILFIAASTPQLLVNIDFSNPEQPRITSYERAQGQDATRRYGPFTLQLRNEQAVITQTAFNPRIIDGQGIMSYPESYTVAIPAFAAANTIELVDEQGDVISAFTMQPVCGDGTCEVSERASCAQDCAQEAVDAYTQPLEPAQPTQTPLRRYVLIGSIVLLIAALIAILIHVNRKKENPIQTQY